MPSPEAGNSLYNHTQSAESVRIPCVRRSAFFHLLFAGRRTSMYQQITIVGNLGADPELRVRR